jgi:hypothetical protein
MTAPVDDAELAEIAAELSLSEAQADHLRAIVRTFAIPPAALRDPDRLAEINRKAARVDAALAAAFAQLLGAREE